MSVLKLKRALEKAFATFPKVTATVWRPPEEDRQAYAAVWTGTGRKSSGLQKIAEVDVLLQTSALEEQSEAEITEYRRVWARGQPDIQPGDYLEMLGSMWVVDSAEDYLGMGVAVRMLVRGVKDV